VCNHPVPDIHCLCAQFRTLAFFKMAPSRGALTGPGVRNCFSCLPMGVMEAYELGGSVPSHPGEVFRLRVSCLYHPGKTHEIGASFECHPGEDDEVWVSFLWHPGENNEIMEFIHDEWDDNIIEDSSLDHPITDHDGEHNADVFFEDNPITDHDGDPNSDRFCDDSGIDYDGEHNSNVFFLYHPRETKEMEVPSQSHPDKAFAEGVYCRDHENELGCSYLYIMDDSNGRPAPDLSSPNYGELAGKATLEHLEADHSVGVTAHELPSALSASRVHPFEVSEDKGVGSLPCHPGNNHELRASFLSCSDKEDELGGSFPYHPGETVEEGVSCLTHSDKDHAMGGPFPYHPGETVEEGVSCLKHPDKDHAMGGPFPYHPGEVFGEGVSCLGHPDEDNEIEGPCQHHLGDGKEGPTPARFGTLGGELLAGKATWDLLEADHIVGVTAHELPSALSTSRVHQLEVPGDRGVGSLVYCPYNNPDLRAPIGGCIGGSFPYRPGEIFAGGVSCPYHPDTDHKIGGCFPYHPGEIFAGGGVLSVPP
jgi:hypothetical protein